MKDVSDNMKPLIDNYLKDESKAVTTLTIKAEIDDSGLHKAIQIAKALLRIHKTELAITTMRLAPVIVRIGKSESVLYPLSDIQISEDGKLSLA